MSCHSTWDVMAKIMLFDHSMIQDEKKEYYKSEQFNCGGRWTVVRKQKT